MVKDIVMEDPKVELGESIKLIRNSKGYTYEIRVRCKDQAQIDDAFIKRLEDINNKMIQTFESGVGFRDPEPSSRANVRGSPYGFSEDHA